MVSTIDQDLIPNALAEFHAAIGEGKSEVEAWRLAVAHVRHDVLQLAIGTCQIQQQRHDPHSIGARACEDCAGELEALQQSFDCGFVVEESPPQPR